jgi:hypothetical protein
VGMPRHKLQGTASLAIEYKDHGLLTLQS